MRMRRQLIDLVLLAGLGPVALDGCAPFAGTCESPANCPVGSSCSAGQCVDGQAIDVPELPLQRERPTFEAPHDDPDGDDPRFDPIVDDFERTVEDDWGAPTSDNTREWDCYDEEDLSTYGVKSGTARITLPTNDVLAGCDLTPFSARDMQLEANVRLERTVIDDDQAAYILLWTRSDELSSIGVELVLGGDEGHYADLTIETVDFYFVLGSAELGGNIEDLRHVVVRTADVGGGAARVEATITNLTQGDAMPPVQFSATTFDARLDHEGGAMIGLYTQRDDGDTIYVDDVTVSSLDE